MDSGGQACWRTILLETPGNEGGGELSRPERLAALYRFQNGEALRDLVLVDPVHQVVLTDPGQVDWTHFPVLDALEAVSSDELRRLHSLLCADIAPPSTSPSSSAPPASAAPSSSSAPSTQLTQAWTPTPPTGMVWGIDLLQPPSRGGSTSEA